jgi:hypothetical protein
MAFNVHWVRGEQQGADYWDDMHDLVIRDNGVIEVVHGLDVVRLYSPHYWAYITYDYTGLGDPNRVGRDTH